MGQHTYQKRFSSADRQPAEVSAPEGLHYSNSALAAMTGADSPSGNNLSDIHDSIMQRFSAPVRESVQAQIPTAEAEADRLSASVKSGSPDAVKAAMGRKMGADFSGVRFHTGKAAEAKASAVDARAYTSGNDVYFGEGGFDPAVAAHELVHTAQQGMVAAATPTVATPVGGVQRKPEKKKGFMHHLSRKVDKLQDKTIGKVKRKFNKAVDQYASAKESGAWQKMTSTERLKWRFEHFPSHFAYNHSEKVRDARQQRLAEAETFRGIAADQMAAERDANPKAMTLIPDAAPAEGLPAGVDPETYIAPMQAGELPESPFFEDEDLQGILDDGTAAFQYFRKGDYKHAAKKGAKAAAATYGKVTDELEDYGIEVPGIPVSEVADAIRYVYMARKGDKQAKAFSTQLAEQTGGKTRDEMVQDPGTTKDDLLLRDITERGQKFGELRRSESAGKATGAGLQAVGKVVGNFAPPIGVAFTQAGKAADKITDQVVKGKKKDMKLDTLSHTTGYSREKDKETLREIGLPVNEENLRNLRNGRVHAAGFGSLSELDADQTEKQAQLVLAQANAGNADYQQVAENLGVHADEQGQYTDQEKAFRRLGGEETRAQVEGRKNKIDSKAAANQQLRIEKEKRLTEKVRDLELKLAVASPIGSEPLSRRQQWKKNRAQKKLDKARKKLAVRVEKNRNKYGIPASAIQ